MSGMHARSNLRSSNSAEDETQEFIKHSDDEKDGRKKKRRGMIGFLRQGSGRWRSRILVLLVLLVTAIIASFTVGQSGDGRPPSAEVFDPSLHIVLFGSKNSTSRVNLCKTVLTTSVLDYPPPTIVNSTVESSKDGYINTYDTVEDGDSFHTRSKIDGVLDELWNKYEEEENDIVIIAEAFDTLLQLPSSLLLDRYYRLNAEAERQNKVKQTIVFAASKTCSSQEFSEPWCYLQPETSSFKSDMYASPAAELPVYLDSGFIMGPVKDLRELFSHAQNYEIQVSDHGPRYSMRRRRHRLSHEAVFNMIYAEQELYRDMARSKHSTWYDRATSHVTGMFSSQTKNTASLPERSRLSLMPSRKYEYHIGLDYTSSLVHVQDTDATTFDYHFIKYSSPAPDTSLYGAQCTPRIRSLSSDLSKADAPFHNMRASLSDSDAPVNLPSWAEVALYTNICTGIVPVAILYRGGSPMVAAGPYASRRAEDWQTLWLQSNAKQLLESQRWRAEQARARVIGGSMILIADSTAEDFDPAVDVLKEKVNVGDTISVDGRRTTAWEELCGSVSSQLF